MIRIDFCETNIVVFTVEGEFTLNAYFEAMKRLEASNRYNPDIDTIWDFTRATGELLTMDDIYAIAENNRKLSAGRKAGWKVAVVAGSEFDYALGRMYEAYADLIDNRIEIFKNMNEARGWIAPKEEPAP